MTAATHERWEAHVAAWARSGVTSKEYAVKAGVNPRTLMWWKSRLKTASAPREVARFVEVTDQVVALEPSTDGVIELDVGGTRILVRGRVDSEALSGDRVRVETRRREADNGAWKAHACWSTGASEEPRSWYELELGLGR